MKVRAKLIESSPERESQLREATEEQLIKVFNQVQAELFPQHPELIRHKGELVAVHKGYSESPDFIKNNCEKL